MKRHSVGRHLVGLVTAMLSANMLAAQVAGRASELSIDSLLNTRISAASKYLQTSAEASASITIVSGEEIRQSGYANLQEVLESVPGFYVTNDRNYPYLGTRGFGRPSDFNNRILVLVDGHTLNEPVWGSAPVGSDLPINFDAIERVEVVRGPGSALYGTSAMFAVINIVTRSGRQVDGAEASGRVGSGLDRQLGFTAGHAITRRSAFMFSALGNTSDGFTQYYPEFSSDVQNGGVVRHLDWERGASALGALTTGNVTTRFGYRTRSKGVPTGSYAVIFGDHRAQTVDGSWWGDVAWNTHLGSAFAFSVRVYADRSTYSGVFPYLHDGPAYTDRSNSTNVGAEVTGILDITSRDRLTIGSELRRMFVAEYSARNEAGNGESSNAPFTLGALFVQNELELTSHIKLVGGLRLDRKLTQWQALAPRVALIATPDVRTTFKLLYGEAYRAPSVSESDLETQYFVRNRALHPERIATQELVLERRLWPSLLVSASAYHYSIHNLIEQIVSDTTTGFRFGNLMPVHGRGLEFSTNMQPAASPLSLRLWYSLQKTRDDSTGLPLTNSPSHTVNGTLTTRSSSGAHGALTLRHESDRRTRSGTSTPSYTRVDGNLGYAAPANVGWSWLRGFDVSVRASNLFDTHYFLPGGLEHVQQSLEQNGRTLTFRVSRTF